MSLGWKLGRKCLQAVGAPGNENRLEAAGGQLASELLSDPGAGACDQGDWHGR